MKKLLGTTVLLLGLSFMSFAQTSQSILNKLSEKAKTYSSIYAEYSSQLIDKQAGLDIKQEGDIKIMDDKYVLNLPDYTIYCDGSNVWTFEKESNVCYIDALEDVQDDTFDPAAMFTIWEHDFKHELMGEEKISGIDTYAINLHPNNPKDKPYHTIKLYVDKAKMEVVKIVVKGREGDDINYSVKTFKTNNTMQDTDFRFNKSKFPGVEIIDQRI
jgi:outer membrane lipoprotein-sorting protein